MIKEFLNSRKENFMRTMKYVIVLLLYAGISEKIENKVIFNHLCCDGISQHYTIWTWHGKWDKRKIVMSHRHEVDEDMDDWLEDMIYDIGEDSFRKPMCLILYLMTMTCRYIRDAKNLHDY